MLENTEVKTYHQGQFCSQLSDGKELLDQMIADGIGKRDIILDVGCRTGSITKMLSTTLEHDQIFAIDPDKKLIEFAEENNKADSIQYFVLKIDAPWDELDPVIQNLEGIVDLVWSNRILHWVRDKARAIANISRLMRPGGRFYSNITLMRDIYESFSKEERKMNEIFVKFVPHDQQLENWTTYFIAAGLSKQLSIELLYKERTFDHHDHIEEFYSTVENYVRTVLPSTMSDEEKRNTSRHIKDLVTRNSQTKFGSPLPNSIDPDNKTIYYGQFRVVAIK